MFHFCSKYLYKQIMHLKEVKTVEKENGAALLIAEYGNEIVFMFFPSDYQGTGSYHSINCKKKENDGYFQFLYDGQLTECPMTFAYPKEIQEKVIEQFKNKDELPDLIDWEED